jgi:hypothetical protein
LLTDIFHTLAARDAAVKPLPVKRVVVVSVRSPTKEGATPRRFYTEALAAAVMARASRLGVPVWLEWTILKLNRFERANLNRLGKRRKSS